MIALGQPAGDRVGGSRRRVQCLVEGVVGLVVVVGISRPFPPTPDPRHTVTDTGSGRLEPIARRWCAGENSDTTSP